MRLNRFLQHEIVRYTIVGGGAVLIDLFTYTLLIQFKFTDPSWAKRIGFTCGAIWSFLINKFYTFRIYNFKISEPVFFAIVYVTGFLINSLIHDWILKSYDTKAFAFAMATCISIVWNYIGQKWLVFRKARNKREK
jgi:putative flippase GtrA